MPKRLFKYLLIAFASIFGLILIASILIYFFLPTAMIKNYVAEKLSEQLGREVKIKSASVNIFSGIKLNGVTIANSQGYSSAPLLSADSLELKYLLFPLIQGKVVIPEINFVRPVLSIEKDKDGNFNFSGLFGAPKPKKGAVPKKLAGKNNKGRHINLIVNHFRMTDGEINFTDYYTGASGIKDLDVAVSNITLITVRPMDVKVSALASYMKQTIPVSFSAKIQLDSSLDKGKVSDLLLSIAGESLSAKASLLNLKSAPKVYISASSNRLTLDPFVAIFAAGSPSPQKSKPVLGALSKSLQKSFSNIPANLTVIVNLDLKNIALKTVQLDELQCDLKLAGQKLSANIKKFAGYKGTLVIKGFVFDLPKLRYSIQKLELHGFSAAQFFNDMIDSFYPSLIDMKNKAEGILDASIGINGAGVEMPDAFDNLQCSGVIMLSKGRLRQPKSLAAIGEKYNINMLKQDIFLSGLRTQGELKDKTLNIATLTMQDTDLRAAFSGKLNFSKMEYVPGNRLNLKFSPMATQALPNEFSIFKDDKGFYSIDFELQGSLYRPFPSPILKNAFETAFGKIKVKVEAKTVEIVSQAKEALESQSKTLEAEAKKKLEEEKRRLEEESKKKVKEILKF